MAYPLRPSGYGDCPGSPRKQQRLAARSHDLVCRFGDPTARSPDLVALADPATDRDRVHLHRHRPAALTRGVIAVKPEPRHFALLLRVLVDSAGDTAAGRRLCTRFCLLVQRVTCGPAGESRVCVIRDHEFATVVEG